MNSKLACDTGVSDSVHVCLTLLLSIFLAALKGTWAKDLSYITRVASGALCTRDCLPQEQGTDNLDRHINVIPP